MDFAQFLHYFIGLIVISNPLSALPALLRITRNRSLSEKRKTGLTTALAVLIILLVATWVGTPLLKILGIELPAFQVSGGIIIFLMSLSMLNAEESPIKQTIEEKKDQRPGDIGAIVPLAMPIIAGPGVISTIIINVNQFPGMYNLALLSISAILVSILMGILLYFASSLEQILGQLGINIINRLGGLILAAISIQMLATGLIGLFPILKFTFPT